MRSDPAAAAGAALLFLALVPPPAAAASLVTWIHVCGSDSPIPLRLPLRKDAPAPCHAAACVTAERKRLRGSLI